jgi:outer membrane lipoprotein SlyB
MLKQHLRALTLLAIGAALSAGCATTTTTATTWSAPPGGGWARPGYVDSITEYVRRDVGNPAGGAVAGALVGGFLFGHHRHPSLFGALAGAAVGAAASQGERETRSYQVVVRFDDGGYGGFVYAGPPPFRPGDRVLLTPQGLTHTR